VLQRIPVAKAYSLVRAHCSILCRLGNNIETFQFENITSEKSTLEDYCLLVAALGYEERSCFISKKLHGKAQKKIALGFDHNTVLKYESNRAWFKAKNFEIKEYCSLAIFTVHFEDVIAEMSAETRSPTKKLDATKPQKIAIDISCLDRARLAAIVSISNEALKTNPLLEFHFFYDIAAFKRPSNVLTPNRVVGPVHKHFCGALNDPRRATTLLVGLGYEENKALGAAEFLTASRIIAFSPLSPIENYSKWIAKANSNLFDEVSNNDVVEYSVLDPVGTLATLDSAVRGLSGRSNIVLLPLGPKIFTLISLFAQIINPEASVWRVSPSEMIEPREVKPSQHFIGLSVGSKRSGSISENK
jgi:hypothetical protein